MTMKKHGKGLSSYISFSLVRSFCTNEADMGMQHNSMCFPCLLNYLHHSELRYICNPLGNL
uniref:Uncharacterized protein LOC105137639 isoform X2 n=1 Tax=Rhizophora mucronata TaxID=61149 RepID=A0A2P2KGU9_RHIMU